MHELALCRAIAASVARHSGGQPVERVRVRIGHFRQVVPDTLRFCWGIQREASGLGGCELDVDHVPAVVTCRTCGASTILEVPLLVCGTCEGTEVDLVSGREFLIEWIEVPVIAAPGEQR